MEQQANAAPKRPTFLTVLCILTWVGCGIAIVSLFLAKAAMSVATEMGSAMGSMGSAMAESSGADASGLNSAMSEMSRVADNFGTYLIIGIVCAVLCLVGSIMMWQLKKVGFYVYVVGELGAPIASIVLLGSGYAFAGGMAILGMIFPVLFVVLYGLNLKHMK